MTTATRLMTAEELFAMPDDGNTYELVGGEPIKLMGTGLEHAYIADNCYGSIRDYVMGANLGRVFSSQLGYRLARDPDTVRIPDISFVRRERLEDRRRDTRLLPRCARPRNRSNITRQLILGCGGEGIRLSEGAGTLMVIVLEPRTHTVSVHRSPTNVVALTEADMLDGGGVLPGWRMGGV